MLWERGIVAVFSHIANCLSWVWKTCPSKPTKKEGKHYSYLAWNLLWNKDPWGQSRYNQNELDPLPVWRIKWNEWRGGGYNPTIMWNSYQANMVLKFCTSYKIYSVSFFIQCKHVILTTIIVPDIWYLSQITVSSFF